MNQYGCGFDIDPVPSTSKNAFMALEQQQRQRERDYFNRNLNSARKRKSGRHYENDIMEMDDAPSFKRVNSNSEEVNCVNDNDQLKYIKQLQQQQQHHQQQQSMWGSTLLASSSSISTSTEDNPHMNPDNEMDVEAEMAAYGQSTNTSRSCTGSSASQYNGSTGDVVQGYSVYVHSRMCGYGPGPRSREELDCKYSL
eukprot:Nk52_evm1s2294 gene=Nk52_evmTU1s2294